MNYFAQYWSILWLFNITSFGSPILHLPPHLKTFSHPFQSWYRYFGGKLIIFCLQYIIFFGRTREKISIIYPECDVYNYLEPHDVMQCSLWSIYIFAKSLSIVTASVNQTFRPAAASHWKYLRGDDTCHYHKKRVYKIRDYWRNSYSIQWKEEWEELSRWIRSCRLQGTNLQFSQWRN